MVHLKRRARLLAGSCLAMVLLMSTSTLASGESETTGTADDAPEFSFDEQAGSSWSR